MGFLANSLLELGQILMRLTKKSKNGFHISIINDVSEWFFLFELQISNKSL